MTNTNTGRTSMQTRLLPSDVLSLERGFPGDEDIMSSYTESSKEAWQTASRIMQAEHNVDPKNLRSAWHVMPEE
jgi:hypothetical protein